MKSTIQYPGCEFLNVKMQRTIAFSCNSNEMLMYGRFKEDSTIGTRMNRIGQSGQFSFPVSRFIASAGRLNRLRTAFSNVPKCRVSFQVSNMFIAIVSCNYSAFRSC